MAIVFAATQTATFFIAFWCRNRFYKFDSALPVTGRNREKAQAMAKQIEAEYIHTNQASSTSPVNSVLFADFACIWLQSIYSPNPKISIDEAWSVVNSWLIPTFGHQDINSITQSQFLQFQAKLTSPHRCSDKSVSLSQTSHVMDVFRQILSDAIVNGMRRFSLPELAFVNAHNNEVKPFTPCEVALILEASDVAFRDYIWAQFFTGLPASVLSRLTWSDVDFVNRKIRVPEPYGTVHHSLSAENLPAIIDMTETVYEAMSAQLYQTENSDLVFIAPSGVTLSENYFREKVMFPIFTSLEWQNTAWEVRRTAVAFWLATGEEVQWVAKQIGYRNIDKFYDDFSQIVAFFCGSHTEHSDDWFIQFGRV